MTLRIHLLGPIQISYDGTSVQIPGHKPLALLAYLLITGQAHSRHHCIKSGSRWTRFLLEPALYRQT